MDLPTAEKLQSEIDQLMSALNDAQTAHDFKKMKALSAVHQQKEDLLKHVNDLNKTLAAIKEAEDLLLGEDDELKTLASDDLINLGRNEQQLRQLIEDALIAKDPMDERNIILEIRSGAGGDEAGLFAAELMRGYTRFAETKGWHMHIVSSSMNEQGGYKEVIAELSGQSVFGTMKFESGVHRVQRIPNTEKQGRIHTSTVTVAVLPQAEEVDIEIKPEDLRIDTYRASGAGGQHVNKTSSAVRITHVPTNTVVAVQDERSQHKNRAKAMTVLRSRLLEARLEKKRQLESSERKQQVGTGDRSEKIRTYNFPQDRITDHRIKQSWRNIEAVMEGNWENIFQDLKQAQREKQMKQ